MILVLIVALCWWVYGWVFVRFCAKHGDFARGRLFGSWLNPKKPKASFKTRNLVESGIGA